MEWYNDLTGMDVGLLLAGALAIGWAIRAVWRNIFVGSVEDSAITTQADEDISIENQSTISLLRMPISLWIIALLVFLSIQLTPWTALHITETATILLYSKKCFYAVTILTIFVCGKRLLNRTEQQVLSGQKKINAEFEQAVHIGFKLAKAFLYLFVIAAILTIFDLKEVVDKLLALGAVSSLIIGFAAQDTLANFFGSVMVMLDRPFKVNDMISSPDKDIKGIVEYIGWRVTRVRDFKYGIKYIPNNNFTKITINNLSQSKKRKFNTVVGVRYADLAKVPKICDEIEKNILDLDVTDKNAFCYAKFNGLGDSSVNITVVCFMKTAKEKIYDNYINAVLHIIVKAVQKHKADFPFPTTTLDAQDLVETLKEKTLQAKD